MPTVLLLTRQLWRARTAWCVECSLRWVSE